MKGQGRCDIAVKEQEQYDIAAKSRKYNMTAGILAGGKSSRMGRNKAFLPWQGTTLLAYEIELLHDFSQIVVSVADEEAYEPLKQMGITLVEDVRKGYGPLEGLYQILKQIGQEWVFVTATDMPMLNTALIEAIIAVERNSVQAVITKDAVHVHPLCGLYHTSILPILEEMFEEGYHSLYQLLQRIEVRYVSLQELGMEENVLTNVNTPEEYESILNGAG